MAVITIRGQFGSESQDIGELIAHKLNIDYVDRKIIATVAEKLRMSSYAIETKEMPPSTLLGRIAEAMATPYFGDGSYVGLYLPSWEIPLGDTKYLSGLTHVVEELAKSQSIVIRGRGSQFILKALPGAFHVLIVTPVKIRQERIMKTMKLSEDAAGREIARFDKGSHEFIKRYFHSDINDPVNYDLVVNTEHISVEAAASIVVHALPLKETTAGEQPGKNQPLLS
jgi:hypothetical protein